ncbi:coagulation factor IX [Coregonus clupeaformis]|uniref:coagulation factor IX n=1 Tax=Coregonus clupeaformis TaxID=59861 RepID=UPI001E1C4503|nr:coagulation factor IX [Coregonus clupeaformis]
MARVCLFVITVVLMVENWFTSGASVFLSRQSADNLLRRQKRYNTGAFEEMKRDNLERECIEERCNLEEAREVFEDMEKTMDFWVNYLDGDQCESNPCQNGGKCKDAMSAYVCWCPPQFNGKNCEIEMAKQCDINNGGCSHFCVLNGQHAVCDCATGYKLAPDKTTCEPEGLFPCGHLGKAVSSTLSSRSIITAVNVDQTQHSYDNAINITEALETSVNNTLDSRVVNATTTTPHRISSTSSSHSSSVLGDLPSWVFFPTLPTIREETSDNKRIVGGNTVKHGEIPWQVALMSKLTRQSFCGGSLLSEMWVITAAHCLKEDFIGLFFIRVGEHNMQVQEGREHDHAVAEYHIHPRYDAKTSLYNHDIALLKLRTPVLLSDYSLPICLGPKDFTETLLREASSSVVSGWGRMRFQGPESSILQKVEVPYVDRTECKGSSAERVSRFMFCAGYINEQKDSCQGDSGGPHATQYRDTWFLTGIVSWGEECAKEGKYGIYTRVSRYFPWISNVTGLRSIGSNSEPDVST